MEMNSLRITPVFALVLAAVISPVGLRSQADSIDQAQADSITIQLVDVDLRHAVQALARYLDKPVVFGELTSAGVTVETPVPITKEQVLGLLQGLLASQNHVLALDSTGVYHVRAGEVEAPVEQRPTRRAGEEGEPPELFFVRLTHARAADVAATVNALYGQAAAFGEIGVVQSTLSDGLRQDRILPQHEARAEQGLAGRGAALAGEVTIVPDAGTNSLLVRAGRSDFELIETVVRELDVRPLQVLIEVLIVEARRDRNLALGLGTELGSTDVGGDVTVSGSTTGLGLGDFVLDVMNLGGIALNATLQAASSRGDAAIVSRPVLLVANNDEAEIEVGSQRPFVQVSRSLPTETPVRDQVVQYKDVGTRLAVRPTISADGYVMLDVTQEINAATTETAFDAPVISTRAVQTQLLIKDGQTVVLGGLTDRQRESSQAGVPLLSDIPIVGAVFGRQSRRTIETELFVFLTPRVIRDDEDVDSTTAPLLEGAEKRGR